MEEPPNFPFWQVSSLLWEVQGGSVTSGLQELFAATTPTIDHFAGAGRPRGLQVFGRVAFTKQACTVVQGWWVTPCSSRAIPGGTRACDWFAKSVLSSSLFPFRRFSPPSCLCVWLSG